MPTQQHSPPNSRLKESACVHSEEGDPESHQIILHVSESVQTEFTLPICSRQIAGMLCKLSIAMQRCRYGLVTSYKALRHLLLVELPDGTFDQVLESAGCLAGNDPSCFSSWTCLAAQQGHAAVTSAASRLALDKDNTMPANSPLLLFQYKPKLQDCVY